ncbi:hypothetical protein M6B38_329570 [Iris pallida]|uniref:Uncharacterized protein n=1 Tax=Iris pallida TaxID=29817 RepID=A0AAX6H5A3_IRIPA|nr:hypothetical protein M6B38_329570 [Iris pallida]
MYYFSPDRRQASNLLRRAPTTGGDVCESPATFSRQLDDDLTEHTSAWTETLIGSSCSEFDWSSSSSTRARSHRYCSRNLRSKFELLDLKDSRSPLDTKGL